MVSQKHFEATTGLTITVSIAWVASLIARMLSPSFAVGPAVDSAMLLVLGYWFSLNAVNKNKKD